MKKILITVLAFTAVISIMSSCDKTQNNTSSNAAQTTVVVSESAASSSNTIVYGSPEAYYQNGKSLRDSINSNADKEVILTVNGKEVTKLAFDVCLSTYSDKQKAYDELIKQQAIYRLKVTDDELNTYVEYNYNAFTQGGEESKKCFSEYCRGLGIEENEYVDLMKSLPTMKEQLLYQKFYQYVNEEYNKTDKSQSSTEYFNDYVDKLVKNANVQIIKDPRK